MIRFSPLELDLVGSDVLRDAPGLPGYHIALAQCVEQGRLAVIDMSHDRHDGRTNLLQLHGIVVLLESDLDIRRGDTARLVSELRDHNFGRVGVNGLVDRHHLAQSHHPLDDLAAAHRHAVGQFTDENGFGHDDLADDLLCRPLGHLPLELLLAQLLARASGRCEAAGALLAVLLVQCLSNGELAAPAPTAGTLSGRQGGTLLVALAALALFVIGGSRRRCFGSRCLVPLGDDALLVEQPLGLLLCTELRLSLPFAPFGFLTRAALGRFTLHLESRFFLGAGTSLLARPFTGFLVGLLGLFEGPKAARTLLGTEVFQDERRSLVLLLLHGSGNGRRRLGLFRDDRRGGWRLGVLVPDTDGPPLLDHDGDILLAAMAETLLHGTAGFGRLAFELPASAQTQRRLPAAFVRACHTSSSFHAMFDRATKSRQAGTLLNDPVGKATGDQSHVNRIPAPERRAEFHAVQHAQRLAR